MSTDFATLLIAAETHLKANSPQLVPIITKVGACTLVPEQDIFASLVRAVIAQLISVKAAQSITAKFRTKVKNKIIPARVLQLTVEEFKKCGISGAKQRTITGLARHFQTNRGYGKKLLGADSDTVREMLLPLFGIGPWTVDMLLIFSLCRPDVLPVGDLGLRAAVKDVYQLEDLPTAKDLIALAAPWQPYRSIATWYLWRSRG